MDTSVRRRLYLLAAALVLVSLLVGGLYPLSSNGAACGTAFVDRTSTSTAVELEQLGARYGLDPAVHDCNGVRSTWRTVWLAVAVGGGVLLAAGWTAGARRSRREIV